MTTYRVACARDGSTASMLWLRPSARSFLARSRGWTIPQYHAPQSFGRDVGAEDADGDQIPLITVFRKDLSGKISLWYAQSAEFPDGSNRGIDLLNPLWGLLDLTPGGRGDYVPPEVVHLHA